MYFIIFSLSGQNLEPSYSTTKQRYSWFTHHVAIATVRQGVIGMMDMIGKRVTRLLKLSGKIGPSSKSADIQ
jgi:hypothetical protein